MKNKKLIASALVVMLAMPVYTAYANTNINSQDSSKTASVKMIENQESKTLTAQEAIDLYLSQSTAIKTIEIDYEILKIQQEELKENTSTLKFKAKDTKEKFERQKSDSKDTTSYKQKRDAYRLASKTYEEHLNSIETNQHKLDNLEAKKEQQVKQLTFDIQKDLWQYKTLQNQKNLLEKSTELKKKEAKVEKTRLDLGLTTDTQVLQKENAYNNSELQLRSLANNLELLNHNLKVKLALPTELKYDFTINIEEFEAPVSIELDSIIKLYHRNSLGEKENNLKRDLDQKLITSMEEVYGAKDDDYKKLSLEHQKKVLSNSDNDKATENALISEYYAYKKAVDKLAIDKEAYLLAEKQYNEGKASFDVGLISQLQLDAIELGKISAKVTYESTVISFNQSVTKLDHILNGFGLTSNASSEAGGFQ